MDSIHCSPNSIRLVTTQANEAPDYESSAESYSVFEDRDDLTAMDVMDITNTSRESLDTCLHNNNSCDNICYESNSYSNYRNNLNISNENNVNNIRDANLPPIAMSNKCHLMSKNYLSANNECKQQSNAPDIESQCKLRRKKSLIHKLYSSTREEPIRLSILGRPIPIHRLRNDISFFKEKLAVYNFLQRPRGFVAIVYHVFVSVVVFVCLLLTVFSTISEYENYATNGLRYMDCLIAALFSSEFVARLWSASCNSHYQGWRGRLRFLRNPFRIIDMLVIITSCIVLFFDTKRHTLFVYFRGFRFFQVFQMLRLEHRFRPWPVMSSVVWQQREHLAITTYMGFLSLLFISFAIYFVEKDVNPAFNNIAAAMYWGVVTLCTVGYGDMIPITPTGKFLSSICIIIGVSIFALPAGILGTGLALKVQEQQRVRQMGKRREPAAKLIQCTWRCYVSSENSISTVTWKSYKRCDGRHEPLTNGEKTAIRFIRVVKYFIARQNFNRALKPYDIKDVLEQYAAGHADVLGRVRHMQSRLNAVQVSVNTNLRALNESKVMLSSRINQIEAVASDMQNKFCQLMGHQIRDMNVIQNLTDILNQRNASDFQRNSLSSSRTSIRTRRNSF